VWLKHVPDAPLLMEKARGRVERPYAKLLGRERPTLTKVRMATRADLCQIAVHSRRSCACLVAP
jgi:hypothetical protein